MKTKQTIKKYNKEYSARLEVQEKYRIKNATSGRKAYRKHYKQTKAGKRSNLKYRRKPEVKLRYQNYRLKKRYGITIKNYWDLVAKQNGVCLICNKSDGHKLHIDHDHKTGKVRGLLCGSCNRGLGMFKEDIKHLKSAIKYLNG